MKIVLIVIGVFVFIAVIAGLVIRSAAKDAEDDY